MNIANIIRNIRGEVPVASAAPNPFTCEPNFYLMLPLPCSKPVATNIALLAGPGGASTRTAGSFLMSRDIAGTVTKTPSTSSLPAVDEEALLPAVSIPPMTGHNLFFQEEDCCYDTTTTITRSTGVPPYISPHASSCTTASSSLERPCDVYNQNANIRGLLVCSSAAPASSAPAAATTPPTPTTH